MGDTTETYQLSNAAAEAYEAVFVPALFADWAERLVTSVDVRPGHRVLDVACGTGIVARTAADRAGGDGRVVGIDLNEGMLAVARRLRPDLEWHHADAADLPFGNGSFDVVLCQAALMFLPDRAAALREMARVATDDGTVATLVWGSFDAQPAYQKFAEIAARHAGDRATDLIRSYFSLGDRALVVDLFRRAGLDASVDSYTGTVRFDSIEDFARGEIDGSPLGELLDRDAYEQLLGECTAELSEFTADDGRTAIPLEGHIVRARKV